MAEMRDAYKILIRKHEESSPFWRPKCRWQSNIKIFVKQIWYKGVI
jgi:hypothetical protein